MNLLQRIALCGLTAASLSGIPSCSEKTTTSVEGENGGHNIQLKYIVFKTICQYGGLGGISVGIFDESTRQRVEYGSTLTNGGYCSQKLDINKSYRIEFYSHDSGQKKCIGWVRNVTFQQNSNWWSDNCDPGYSASENIGFYNFGACSNFGEATDCWGQ